MDDIVPFASRDYCLFLLILAFARSMDFLSTWVATPNLVLEGNPIAKRLGWKLGIPVNIVICLVMAFWPITAVAIGTTSVLVAGRNFQSAWLMRSMGEDHYREWHVARIQETRITLYLFCLAGQTLLIAAVGAALIHFSSDNWVSNPSSWISFSIGLGIVAYAGAIAFYTLLALWRLRRNTEKKTNAAPFIFVNNPVELKIKDVDTNLLN